MHVVNILVFSASNCLEIKCNLIICLSVILLSYRPYINIGSISFLLEHGILRCPSVLMDQGEDSSGYLGPRNFLL